MRYTSGSLRSPKQKSFNTKIITSETVLSKKIHSWFVCVLVVEIRLSFPLFGHRDRERGLLAARLLVKEQCPENQYNVFQEFMKKNLGEGVFKERIGRKNARLDLIVKNHLKNH